ncbi:MAG TPA: hypothetical protein DEF42_11480 [Desulfosporosinus sp.]|nr:hypothetical protein [Desulfosporosinus sp.]
MMPSTSCESKLEPKNVEFQEKQRRSLRNQKYYGLIFPIPTIAIIIISLIFDVLLWQVLGFRKYPDRPYEDKIIDECF